MVSDEPARLLGALGADRRPEVRREWTALVDGRSAFASWHAGSAPVTMADLAATLRDAPLLAPRTGHIGDWRDMARGCSSILDYNGIICRDLAAGYPLQYDFSQTETRAGDGGDTLFLPGSLVERGVRRALPLFRWSDRGFVAHDRTLPLFVPFVATEHEGTRLPLTHLHRRRAQELGWFDVDYHSDLLVRCREQVREVLTVLVTAAGRDDRQLAHVFDRVVHRDGRIERVPVTAAAGGWRVADQRFATVDALVEASLVPAEVAWSSEPLDGALRQAPAVMPFASMYVVHLLHALLGTHRPDRRPRGDGSADLHVHWGALAMAGYPPGRRGYFAGKASKVKSLSTTVVSELAWPSPTLFALVPTAPYLLWVPASRPGDLAAIESLLRRVGPVLARWPGQTVRTSPAVHEMADDWLAGEGRGASAALRQQFGWADRTSRAGPLPEADMVKPAGFDDLTVGDACLVVAAVVKAFRRSSPTRTAEPAVGPAGLVASPIGPILLTSRDYGEYLEMFDLAPDELEGRRVLDCPGGASDFTARLHRHGGDGVGVDPLYVLSAAKMERRIRDELERGTRRLDEAPQLYDRAWMGSPESYLRRRARSAEVFLHDYSDAPHRDGRYVAAALPHLPFRPGAFDLALVGNLLFAYADHFDVSWHRQAVHELLRVSREVRVHPLQETSGRPYRHADHLVELLRTDGVDVDVRPVPYRLHPGVNETLICRHPAPC